MKKSIIYLFTIAFLLFANSAFSQNENSLLWKISGNGLEKNSYVFGTIHVICEDDFFMNDRIERALDDSEILITEINFGNFEELMLMQNSMQSKESLKDRISSEQYNRLGELLKDKLALDIVDYDFISEAGIASLVTIKSFGCDNQKMYEAEFLQRAMLSQKQLNGLESISEQMQVMKDHLNIDVVIKVLEEMGTSEDINDEMVTLYKKQNIDALLALLKKTSYMNPVAYDEFVVNRNNKWVNKMPELMKSNAVFFAVGAAHLGSDDGVLQLLRKQGYKVEAVF